VQAGAVVVGVVCGWPGVRGRMYLSSAALRRPSPATHTSPTLSAWGFSGSNAPMYFGALLPAGLRSRPGVTEANYTM